MSESNSTRMNELAFFKWRVESIMPTRKYFRESQAYPGKTLLIDVRNSTAEELGAVIPGATRVPEAEIKDRLSELPKNKPIVVYTWDDWCNLAAYAAITLLENGFSAMVLSGGIAAWQALNFPTEDPMRSENHERTAGQEESDG